ncbi:hypothetical protein CLF_102216, partial [Clonorchis sinensis]
MTFDYQQCFKMSYAKRRRGNQIRLIELLILLFYALRSTETEYRPVQWTRKATMHLLFPSKHKCISHKYHYTENKSHTDPMVLCTTVCHTIAATLRLRGAGSNNQLNVFQGDIGVTANIIIIIISCKKPCTCRTVVVAATVSSSDDLG